MKFIIKTNAAIFDAEEIEILERWGDQFERLMNGDRPPRTPAQEQFVQVSRFELEPETIYEKVWWKYQKRLEWEGKPENWSAMGPLRKAPESFAGRRGIPEEIERGLAESPGRCPRCDQPLMYYQTKRPGPSRYFVGCSAFPDCRYKP